MAYVKRQSGRSASARVKVEYHDNHFESDHFEKHWVDPTWEVQQIERAINYHKRSLKMTKSDKRKSQIQRQIENLEFDKCQIKRKNQRRQS